VVLSEPSPGCVLVVDDADGLRRLVALVLRTSGYTVVEAATEAEALAAQADHAVHTMLVDVQLGDTSGLDLVRAIRATPAGARARVVLMTGAPDVDRATLTELGVSDVLTKPVTIDQIVDAVRCDGAG
jgi:DNA-binding response OmpR family regulator